MDKELSLHIENPRMELITDSSEVIEKYMESRNRLAYGYYNDNAYNDYDDDDDESYWDDQRRYWNMMGFGMTDEEWEDYQDEIKRYDKALRKGSNGSLSSQKFINGIEVDDEEFERLNNKGKTRRGGKKHKQRVKKHNTNKGTTTRYNDDDWWESHYADRDRFQDSIYSNEEKTIVFYRNLPDEEDVYKWNNLHEFNEWLEENGVEVDKRDISNLLYRAESHCCLNPETMSKVLVVERTYGDLVWEITKGDIDMLKDTTNHWNYHNL